MKNGIIMSQSFSKFYSHIVFHTRNNVKFIRENLENELYSYMGGILRLNPFLINEHPITLSCALCPEPLADLRRDNENQAKYKIFYFLLGYKEFNTASC